MQAEWAHQPGVLIADLPGAAVDPGATIVRIELDGALRLVE